MELSSRMTLKERLYLSPFERYRRYKIFPWEAVLSLILAVLTVSQVLLTIRASSTYSYNQMLQWNRLFLSGDVLDMQIAPTDTGIYSTFAIYSRRELTEFVKTLVEVGVMQTYYDLNDYTLSNYEVFWTNGEKQPPVLSSRFLRSSYTESTATFPSEYRLTRLDLGPFSDSQIDEYLRVVDSFEVKFTVKQRFRHNGNVPESCYQWNVRHRFDFSLRSVAVCTQMLTRLVCEELKGNGDVGVLRHYVWIDVSVGVCGLFSLFLLWRDFVSRMTLTSRLQALGSWQDLRLSEKLKFFNTPTLITMVGNYLQLLSNPHSGALVALDTTDIRFEVYEVFAGLGCFCACVTVVKCYDHTSSFYILVNTLRRSAGDLLMYLLGLMPIMLAYALLGMCWFWPSGYFLSLFDTLATLQCMMFGDSIAFFMGMGLEVNLFFAQVYFYTYIVLVICVVQLIVISYIRAAFRSIRTHPVSLLDDDTARHRRSGSDGLSLPPAYPKEKLQRNINSELRSSRALSQFLSGSPVSIGVLELNTKELEFEADSLGQQITELMRELKEKAEGNKDDPLAVARFRELVSAELPQLLRDGVEGLG